MPTPAMCRLDSPKLAGPLEPAASMAQPGAETSVRITPPNGTPTGIRERRLSAAPRSPKATRLLSRALHSRRRSSPVTTAQNAARRVNNVCSSLDSRAAIGASASVGQRVGDDQIDRYAGAGPGTGFHPERLMAWFSRSWRAWSERADNEGFAGGLDDLLADGLEVVDLEGAGVICAKRRWTSRKFPLDVLRVEWVKGRCGVSAAFVFWWGPRPRFRVVEAWDLEEAPCGLARTCGRCCWWVRLAWATRRWECPSRCAGCGIWVRT